MNQAQVSEAMKQRIARCKIRLNRFSAKKGSDQSFTTEVSQDATRVLAYDARQNKVDCLVDKSGFVRVEINAATLLQLLKGRRLCAADLRCLDCESKRCLVRLLLRACAHDLAETPPAACHLVSGGVD